MVIYGSGSIVSAFMNLGLIDEYCLFINPVILGGGKPLFRDLKARHGMRLIEEKSFTNGVVLLHYHTSSEQLRVV